MAREDLLAQTFVEIADVAGTDEDGSEMCQLVAVRCVKLFDACAAGILLADAAGTLRVAASTSAQTFDSEMFEIQASEGPCSDCYSSGQPVAVADIASMRNRWPHFTPIAVACRFSSIHAAPVSSRGHVIGSLNLFRAAAGNLTHADTLAVSALAEALAIALLNRLPTAAAQTRSELVPPDGQALVAQATGMLTGQAGIPVGEALDRIARYAHYHDLGLVEVSREIVSGSLNLATIAETAARRRRGRT